MGLSISSYLSDFADSIAKGAVEIYNEASVQYELAIFLRHRLGSSWKIQLERNIDHFGLHKHNFQKKEMDIVVFLPDMKEKHCIELKYPTQGQVPEQMFSACKDIKFLEQLVASGFAASYFMMFADNHLFYNDVGGEEIYMMFRKTKVIRGNVTKPTGARNEAVSINGEYSINWKLIRGNLKYFVIEVQCRDVLRSAPKQSK